MISSQQVYSAFLDVTVDPAGDAFYPIFKAPKPVTIVSRSVSVKKTQNAGTAIAVALHNYDTTGTAIKASGGTIGAALGGTASGSRLTLDVPSTSATFVNPVVLEGEWVVAKLTEEGSGWQSGDAMRLQVDYVYGKAGTNA
jgi:hypothetical protein